MSLLSGMEHIFLDHFNEHGESSIPFLVNGKVSSLVMLSAYKRLPPIEEMPDKEKQEMKLYINDLFPEKSVEEKVNAAKIVYTIGTLIN